MYCKIITIKYNIFKYTFFKVKNAYIFAILVTIASKCLHFMQLKYSQYFNLIQICLTKFHTVKYNILNNYFLNFSLVMRFFMIY